MTNIFSDPLGSYCYEVIYHIHLNCDDRAQKALFCLSPNWRKYQEYFQKNNLEALQNVQALANRRFRDICALLRISIHFEGTNCPFNFNHCKSVKDVMDALKHFYEQMWEINNIKPNFISSIPLEGKYSKEIRENQLDQIPSDLVDSFQNIWNQHQVAPQIALKILATNIVENEKHLLMLADFAREKGLDGIVIEVYVNFLISEIDNAMQLEDQPARDIAFRKICRGLISVEDFKQAFEYSDNIEDVHMQSHIRFEICKRLNNQNQNGLVKQIYATIEDPEVKKQAYYDLFADPYVKRYSKPGELRVVILPEEILKLRPNGLNNVAHVNFDAQKSSVGSPYSKSIFDVVEKNNEEKLKRFLEQATRATGSVRSDKFVKVCHLLNQLKRHQEALQHSKEIIDPVRRSEVLSDAVIGLDRQEQTIGALDIARCIDDPFYKFFTHLSIFDSNMDDEKFKILKNLAENIDDIEDREDAFRDLANVAHQRNKSNWHKLVYPLLDVDSSEETIDHPHSPIFDDEVSSLIEKAKPLLYSENETIEKFNQNPQDEWYMNVREGEQDPENRDQILAILAQEAKENGWDREFQLAIGKINDPAIVSSFF